LPHRLLGLGDRLGILPECQGRAREELPPLCIPPLVEPPLPGQERPYLLPPSPRRRRAGGEPDILRRPGPRHAHAREDQSVRAPGIPARERLLRLGDEGVARRRGPGRRTTEQRDESEDQHGRIIDEGPFLRTPRRLAALPSSRLV